MKTSIRQENEKGLAQNLFLGNLDSTRDWGHSKDYVRAMQVMLQFDRPDDFVFATGQSHSVRELCEYVFKYLDLNYYDHVVVDQQYIRPLELSHLKGDATKFLSKANEFEFEYTFETMLNEIIEYWMEKINV